MRAAALKAQASRWASVTSLLYGDDKGPRQCINNESERARDPQGG